MQQTLSGAFVRLLLDWLRGRDAAPGGLVAALERLRLQDRVSVLQWHAWLVEATRSLEISAGLSIGACIDTGHLGLLGHLVRSSPNLRAALQDYLRFEGLQYGSCWAVLVDEPVGAVLRWEIPAGISAPLVEIVGPATIARDKPASRA